MMESTNPRAWPALLAWALGWAAMLALDGTLDLANLALLLMLSSAVASLWMGGWATAVASAVAVAAFNWVFVPPRQAFGVDLRQHALLLATMLVVNWIISGVMLQQRRQAQRARDHAAREARLRGWGDTLRGASDPTAFAGELQQALQEASGRAVALTVLRDPQAAPDGDDVLNVGALDAEQRAGLAWCVRQNRPLGPDSGHHEEQPDAYLPLRGSGAALGAAVLVDFGSWRTAERTERGAHAQALCDQMGQALQRFFAQRQEQRSREEAQAQGVRNALLAAISHDYRTPLATIMGAASSLAEQGERLNDAQRHQLATGIVDEAARLARLTDNTLQLARLDAPGVMLRCDWESAEEIAGAVLRRVRGRDTLHRVRARLEPDLPLLWCDAMLMSQLLDNLIDNALKYSPEGSPVEVLVRRTADAVVLAVRDRGPGIAPAAREGLFEVFRRGGHSGDVVGTGVGLAVCRAIARAHGGELRLRARGRGGSSFECSLPLRSPPPAPEPA